MVEYWAALDMPEMARLEGLAFSILVALDGEAAAIPAFIVAPYPHPDDKHYHVENGENYYPENHDPEPMIFTVAVAKQCRPRSVVKAMLPCFLNLRSLLLPTLQDWDCRS